MSLHAVFPVEDSLNCLFLLVQVLNDGLCIVLSASRKNIYIVALIHFFQKLEAMGAYIKLELLTFIVEFNIRFLAGEDGVDQSLIQVEHQALLFRVYVNEANNYLTQEASLSSYSDIPRLGL